MRVRLIGLMALMTMIVAGCGGGAPEAAGPFDGIQVHGDWTIDIYEADGSLDRHVEFENALFDGGAVLAGTLGDLTYPGAWAVELFSDQGSQPCLSSTGDPTSCFINQPYPLIEELGDSANSMNLSVQAQDDQLVLTGSHAASADGQIDQVKTHLLTCDQPLTAVECSEAATESVVFTFKSLESADIATVSAGQTIQVEVVISFTSG